MNQRIRSTGRHAARRISIWEHAAVFVARMFASPAYA